MSIGHPCRMSVLGRAAGQMAIDLVDPSCAVEISAKRRW